MIFVVDCRVHLVKMGMMGTREIRVSREDKECL